MDRLNWSTLKNLHVSPKLLQWRLEHPRPDTADLRLGRAIHCAILEPEAFGKRWITAGKCAAVTKAGTQCTSTDAVPASDAFEVLEPSDAELVAVCAENVRAHPVAAQILSGGHSEQRMEWTDAETGIECRGTVDYLRVNDLVDLKSTRRDNIREFSMDCARNLYHGQLAWYRDGAIAAGRLPADAPLPHIVMVSTVEPYDVAVLQLSKATLEAGRILYGDLLQKYLQCRAAGWWPGIAPDLQTLDLPNWAPGMNGSEEEGTW